MRAAPAQRQRLAQPHRARYVVRRHHLLQVARAGVDQQAARERVQVRELRDHDVADAGVREHRRGVRRHVRQQHQRRRARVLELVLHLARGVERVGVHDDQPGAQRPQAHHRVLHQVRHLDRDAIPGLQVRVMLQPRREGRGQPVELAERERVAQAAQRGLVGKARRRGREHRLHAVVLQQPDVLRHARGGPRPLDQFHCVHCRSSPPGGSEKLRVETVAKMLRGWQSQECAAIIRAASNSPGAPRCRCWKT